MVNKPDEGPAWEVVHDLQANFEFHAGDCAWLSCEWLEYEL